MILQTRHLRDERDRTRGLTLIELMVVIAILATMLAMAGMRLDGVTSNSRLKATARRIGSTIEFLQNQAIVNGRFYFLQIDIDADRMRIAIAPEWAREGMEIEGETRDLPWRTFERGVQIERLTFDDGVVSDQDRIDLPFGPTGMTWGFLVHLINEEGRRYTVEANAVTGLVAYYPYDREIPIIEAEQFR